MERVGGRLMGTSEIGVLWGNALLRNPFLRL